MRLSPSGPDPLDPGPSGFAHRGLHGPGVPENTPPAFRAAIEFGSGIECDLRLTADDQLIVFHDADVWRLCANPLKIGQSSWSDVAALRVGGHSIPRLGSLLSLVSGQVPLLLEAKVDGDVKRWTPALKRDLAGYSGRFAVMSFDARLCRLIKRQMPGVRRGLLIKQRQGPFERNFQLSIADPDFLGVEASAIDMRWVVVARQRMPVYAWTIRSAGERAQAEVQADALIWEGDGRPRN